MNDRPVELVVEPALIDTVLTDVGSIEGEVCAEEVDPPKFEKRVG